MTVASTSLFAALAALALAQSVDASSICYDGFGRAYYCSGLSTGARIAIGVCVGVGVFLIIVAVGAMRRKKLSNQWAQHRPPPPIQMQQTSDNPYANNPPPPTGVTGADSPYGGANVAPPANSYQPPAPGDSKANTGTGGGQHNLAADYYGSSNNPSSNNAEFADHSYEYEQAAANAAHGGGPPGYDTTATGYAPPSGPPPAHVTGGSNTQYSAPTGPPPGNTY